LPLQNGALQRKSGHQSISRERGREGPEQQTAQHKAGEGGETVTEQLRFVAKTNIRVPEREKGVLEETGLQTRGTTTKDRAPEKGREVEGTKEIAQRDRKKKGRGGKQRKRAKYKACHLQSVYAISADVSFLTPYNAKKEESNLTNERKAFEALRLGDTGRSYGHVNEVGRNTE